MSLRPSICLLLPLTLLVAGCDRETPEKAQPASVPSGTESDASATEGDAKALNGTLDIAKRGAAMPDFTFSDPSGAKLRLADLKGKPVLVNLWATWCGPCVLEMPMLDKLAQDYDGRLRVVTVSQDMGQVDKVKALFAEKKFAKLQPWLDPENNLGFHYNTGLLPTTVLYDAAGKEVWRMVGAHDWSGPRTAALLADTLAK
ncbi:TlpA family protein disulfide reductase [Novosphingobium sp. KCTC 2891]|uniref:TlpA family protein disulfide reductase n=1 Tax=Novosphingobium sp. KCTC 2891 TaxID=2989730 RepID=UPI002221CC90|nr:TlpA disulfide reductase family protein [Novosphingobium sp. KCTC 2891]MCW1382552.1 TlpA family protein disulfide reductase [Novosphingobium sp. KCTC 2891]